MFDLICIGALNVDYLISKRDLLSVDTPLLFDIESNFEPGTERPIDESNINDLISRNGLAAFDISLGGSSFNTLYTIAAMNLGLRLGYIGIAGETGIDNLDFCNTLEEFGVDRRYVFKDHIHRAGVCISFMHEGERSLFTFPGSSIKMPSYLMENYDGILGYLSKTKLIHLTSFFDNHAMAILLLLLTEAKRKNPWLRISFDPGYHMLKFLSKETIGLLRITDYLFLNAREYNLLGHCDPGSHSLDLAMRIFDICNANSLLIVLKQAHCIRLLYRLIDRPISACYNNVELPLDLIRDATGAGDVLAGGFLSAILIPTMELRHGVELGLRLVKAKLLSVGARSFHTFPAIFRSLIDEISTSVNP
jgi:sugar/nucleoside kinase (ribokinase family)